MKAVGWYSAGEEGLEFLDDMFGERTIFILSICNEGAQVILEYAVTQR